MITLDDNIATRLQERADYYGRSVEDLVGAWLDMDEDLPLEICYETLTNMASSIIVTDKDAAVMFVNPACETVTGYTRAEFTGHNCNFLQGSDRDQPERAIIREALASGEPCNVVLRNYRKDGTLFYNDLHISPIRNDAGEVQYFVGVQNDITSRVETQQSLEESEARYRLITELMADYAFSVEIDEDGNQQLEWLSDSFTRITGYSAEQFTDRELVREIIHPDDQELLHEHFTELYKGETVTRDYRFRIKNGNTRWLRIRRYPFLDEQGRLKRYVGIAQDVSHEMQAFDVAIETQERFWNLADQTPILIWMSGQERGVVYVNTAWRNFTGRELYQELGFDWLEGVHPDDRAMLIDNYNNAFDHREAFDATFRLRQGDGQYRWIRTTGVPRYTPSGEFEGYIGSGTDITDLITARQQLEFYNKELEKSIQERTEALKKREHQYRMLSEMSSDYAYALRREDDGRIIQEWMTAASEDITGYTRAELDELNYDIIHPDDRGNAYQVFEELWSTQTEKTIEGRIIHKDGSFRFLRTHARSIWDDEKQRVVRVMAGTSDVTEARMAQQALEDSEKRYRAVSELASDYAFSWYIHPNGETELEWITDAFERWTGYDAHRFSVTELVKSLIHREDQTHVSQMMDLVAKKASTIELEYRLVSKDGDVLYTHSVVRSEWNEDEQRVDRLVGVARDITERKLAEEALRESEERYRYLSEITSDYAFSFKVSGDKSLELEWVTDALGTITGFTETDFADAETRIQLIAPEYREEWHGALSRLLNEPGTVTIETEFVRKNGEPINMRLILRSVGTSRVERLLGAASDVHEKTLAENALRESEARYRAISELMSDYVYSFRVNEDHSLSLEWVTDSVERVMGYSSEEFSHVTLRQEMIAPAFTSAMSAVLKQLLEGPRDIKFDLPAVTKSGESRYLQSYVRSQWDEEQQRVVRIIGAVTDVTERERTAQALKESEARYRLISESVSDYAYSIYVTPDLHFELEWVTEAFEHITGYDPDDMKDLNKWLPIIFNREDFPSLENFIRQLLRQDYSQHDIDVRMVTNSGDQRYVRFTLRALWSDEEQRVIRLIGVARDITERRQAEAELRQSEARYRQVVETQTELISHFNIHTLELTFVNPAYCRFFGKPFEDLIGTNILTTVPEDERARIEAYARSLYDNPRVSENTGRVFAGDGSIRIIHWVDQVILDDEGNPVEGQSIGTDITELVKAQEALASERNLLSKITSISPVGIVVVEQDSTLSFFNDAFMKIMQLEKEQLDGQSIRNWPLRLENGNVIPVERAPFQTILRTGQPIYNKLYRLNLDDGTHKFLSISGVPMFENDDTVARVLFNCEDITLRKRWEDELQKSYETQKELNDLKTQFVSMVSHEFRTPLTIILTSTGLLRLYGDGLTTDQLHYRLMKIDTQITRLTHLLDDIAFINKGSAVGIPVNTEVVHIPTFVDETIAEVNMAYPENGGIIVENPDGLETIETDENLLHHAFINLLTNAIKYSSPISKVVVTLSLQDEQFILSVQDKGIGIPEKDKDKLFETFQRASNVGTISGTGLGLAITKQCIERIDGDVTFNSTEGAGSKFIISVPVSTYSKIGERLS